MALRDLEANIKLLILGTGPLEEQLRLVAKIRSWRKSAVLGHVDIKGNSGYLTISDIFCRPSLSEGVWEFFYRSNGSGNSVIATPVGGITDFLFDPEKNLDKESTGLFALCATRKALLKKYSGFFLMMCCARIVANAKKLAHEKYNWDLIATEMQGKVFNTFIV